MKKSSHHSEIIFNLNERLFINAIKGVTDEQATQRISDHNNPFNWLVTHTVWARYNIAAFLGKPVENPYSGMFENFKAFDDTMQFDSLETLKAHWEKASALVKEGLATITEEQLDSEGSFKNPTGEFTIGGSIAFLAQHESYDIGQMGLLKKYLTNEAMSYS